MDEPRCGMFWGSHGCDLAEGHPGLHRCLDCCESAQKRIALTHVVADENSYGAPQPGTNVNCAGSWPYYGRKNMTGDGELRFFRIQKHGGFFDNLPCEFDRMAAERKTPGVVS